MGLILGRRSIRVYSPGEVSEPAVTRLLEAAMAAPSAMTKDPWRFVTVRDKQTLSKLAALHPGAAMLSSAAMAIVVCGDLDAAFERQISYLLQDCSAAIENLLLAAHAQGLGACWVGIHPGEAADQAGEGIALACPRHSFRWQSYRSGSRANNHPRAPAITQHYVRAEKW